MTNGLKKASLVDVMSYVFKFLDNEKHIENNAKRQELLDLLCASKAIKSLVKDLKLNQKERHAKYRIKFTFYVRDMMHNKSSKISKWAAKNNSQGNEHILYYFIFKAMSYYFQTNQHNCK